MNKNQTRHENRDKAVLNFMDNDPLSWNTQAIIVTKHDALEDSVVTIDELATIQQMDITGNTKMKALNKLLMAQKGIEIAGPLAQWAKDTGNLELFYEINFSFTSLLARKDTTAKQRNQLVHDRADTNITALGTGGYGVDAGALTAYQTLIDNFNSSISTPKDAEAVTIAASAALDLEIRKADDLVTDLKRLIKPLKTTAVDFYNGFFASAKIVNIGSRKIYAQIKLLDDISGAPIPKGTVEVRELNKTVNVSKRGFARIKDAETGTFTLIVNSPNYTGQTISNFVMDGVKPARLTVRMVKTMV
jgi:hypothetical protein